MKYLSSSFLFCLLYFQSVSFIYAAQSPSAPPKPSHNISLREFTKDLEALKLSLSEEKKLDYRDFIIPEEITAIDEIQRYLREKKAGLTLLDRPNWWEFMVDGKRTEKEVRLGAQVFEGNEKNYIRGMAQGFAFMYSTLDQPLSVNMIMTFHRLAVQGVQRVDLIKRLTDGVYFEQELPKSMSKVWGYPINIYTDKSTTIACLDPILDELKRDGLGDFVGLFKESSAVTMKMRPEPIFKSHRPSLMRYFLEKYLEEMSRAGADAEKKLMAISRFMRRMVSAHFFPDGNGRTIVFILLNRLLLENGMMPAVMDGSSSFNVESFYLEDFSMGDSDPDWQIKGMVRRIKRGQGTFAALFPPQASQKKPEAKAQEGD